MAFPASSVRTAGPESGERRADEAFCQSCGAIISREAAICVACGVATRRTNYGSGIGTGEGKSKTASILFAIFFSYFTWLYTYREDSAKFWVSFAVNAVCGVLFVFTLGLFVFIWLPVAVGFWIWSVVDVASKRDDWYANY